MTKWLLTFIMLVSASPALSEKSSELVVVGVYRPLELTGRRIHVERTVYLRVGEFEKVPSIAVGTIMGIYRAPGRSVEILPRNGAVDSLPQDPFLQSRDRDQEAVEPALGLQPTPLQQVLRSELPPAAPLERTESGRPAGFGQIPGDSTDDERQAEGKDSLDPGALVVGTQVRVGTIRVERIHQGTFVATVVSDGLAPKKTINVQPHEKFMVAILAGDIARIDEVPKKVVKTRKAVGPKNIKQLRKERDALVRALRRKARKPKPFRRRVMKWDL